MAPPNKQNVKITGNKKLVASIQNLGLKLIEDKDGPDAALTFKDKIRLFGSGILMDLGDEAESLVDTVINPSDNKSFSERYATNLAINQEELEQARNKDGSLKYEIAGAFLPAAVTAIPTGGSSIVATAGRLGGKSLIKKFADMGVKKKLATVGGGQGAVVSVGKGEDANILDRVDEFGELLTVGKDAAFGAGASVVGGKAIEKGGQLIGNLFSNITRSKGGQLAREVEDELFRIATSSGKTVDEIVAEIQAGKIIPEIDENIAKTVRGFVSESTTGGSLISEKITDRASQKTKDVFTSAQQDLAPETLMDNVKKYFIKKTDDLKLDERDAYKVIFKDPKQTDANYSNIAEEILDIANNRPLIGKEIADQIQDAGLGKIFKEVVTESGETTIVLNRNVNLEVAENAKRALMDLVQETKKPNKRIDYQILEKSIKEKIDALSPELSKTRKNWASIMMGQEAFKNGQKALSKNADDIEIEVEDIILQMNNIKDPTILGNFRLGVVTALRAKSGSTSTKSFIRNLMKENSNIRKVLEKVYPEEKLDDIIKKIEVADGALMAQNIVVGGSPTAKTIAEGAKIGTAGLLGDLAKVSATIATGVPTRETGNALTRLFKRIVPNSNMSELQMYKVAELLIEENPNIIKNALTDITARNKLISRAQKLVKGLGKAVSSASAITAAGSDIDLDVIGSAIADEVNPSDYRGDYQVIKDLTKTIKPNAKKKILATQGDGLITKLLKNGDIVNENGDFIKKDGVYLDSPQFGN